MPTNRPDPLTLKVRWYWALPLFWTQFYRPGPPGRFFLTVAAGPLHVSLSR